MTGALAPVNASALERLDPSSREVAVTQYLETARDRLALAVQATGPAAVAAIKAEIATAAEATKQLGLSREIQTDAQEMVRRAEFALGKAIRAGQDAGEIMKRGDRGSAIQPYTRVIGGQEQPVRGESTQVQTTFKPSPTDYAEGRELSNSHGGIYDLVDDVTEPEFEAALSDARDEGNLSRANVVRKVKGVKTEGLTPVERLRKIRDLAPSGMTSQQIGRELGVTEQHVRHVARDNNITIQADVVMRGRQRLRVDSNHIVNHAVTTLEAVVANFELINHDDLDVTQAENWATSLTESIRALNRLNKQIKEMTRG